jgi:SAM-dependent methyltransferase
LGDARRVLNVGAGTGSYEPADRVVFAVEPSSVMWAQRARSSARVYGTRAVAEALPFAAGAFDAAMAVLTVHHWSDRQAGYAEMRRVARRIVVLTYYPDVHAQMWIVRDYLPEMVRLDHEHRFSIDDIVAGIGATEVMPVLVPWDCADGFLMAYWRRPHAYLDPAVARANSGFALIDPHTLASGLSRLRSDLESGRWHERYAHLIEADTFDAGLRLVVANAAS